MKTRRSGFTLVEIMLVVAIIALLAAIAIPNLLRSRTESQKTFAQATLKTISTALENYIAINSIYPTDYNDLLTAAPPYLNTDYFTGTYNNYTFSSGSPTNVSYNITALPATAGIGLPSYTITTGGVLVEN